MIFLISRADLFRRLKSQTTIFLVLSLIASHWLHVEAWSVRAEEQVELKPNNPSNSAAPGPLEKASPSDGNGEKGAALDQVASTQVVGCRVEHKGVTLIVLVPALLGQSAIPIDIILMNDGRNHACEFTASEGMLDCQMEITGDDGRPLEYTATGKNRVGGESKNQFGFASLTPGDTRHWQCDAAPWFEPLGLGHCFISLETRVGGMKFIAERIPLNVHKR
jgi:hypothetical protein